MRARSVSKHLSAMHYPSALLFFTIPNFCTGGRVRLNAPACRAGVLFEEPTQVQILPRAPKVPKMREREVTGSLTGSNPVRASSNLAAPAINLQRRVNPKLVRARS